MGQKTETLIFSTVENIKEEILKTFMDMLRIPALAPVNNGDGEGRKADYLMGVLETLGMDRIEGFTARDTVPRPNIVAWKFGKDRSRRLWVMCHMDVVPVGEISLWDSNPFEPVIRDGKVYGRGTEDNGQELIASLYGLKVLNDLEIRPAMDIGLILVSDEETGSQFGIRFLLDKGIFREGDLIIVPDAGNEDATELEIAEKSILWLKVTTRGKQVHASTPHRGNNAHFAGMKFGVRATEELRRRYDITNSLFDPPASTFEPTKKEANVQNINTLPGEDVFYMDCRILPEIDPEHAMRLLGKIAAEIEDELGVTIDLEAVQFEPAAPPTSEDAPVVKLLADAVRTVWKNDPRPRGIGGGTCAAILRRAGFEAVVWGRIDETAHAPNEYSRIENLLGSTKVYALLYAGL